MELKTNRARSGGGAHQRGALMTADLSVADRLTQLLDHLKIERAHFAASMLADVTGFVQAHSERIASLTLVCPPRVDPSLHTLGNRLLIIAGDQGRPGTMVRDAIKNLPEATAVWLSGYSVRRGPMLSLIALQTSKALYSAFSRRTHRRRIKGCSAMLRVQLRALPTTVKAKARRSCYYR